MNSRAGNVLCDDVVAHVTDDECGAALIIDPPTLTADDLPDPGCTVVINVTSDTHVTGGDFPTVTVTSGRLANASVLETVCEATCGGCLTRDEVGTLSVGGYLTDVLELTPGSVAIGSA